MPQLGLGLGLNKNKFIQSGGTPVDPIIEAMQLANATLYIDMDSAGGLGIPGVNAPLTTPVQDLINSNDATLNNFAGTTADGYDSVPIPAKDNVTMLKADGVNSYGTIADNASLDPTGTEDFAICGVFKTGASLVNSYLLAKNLSSSASVQFGVFIFSDGRLNPVIDGTQIDTPTGTVTTNAMYSFKFLRINNVLKFLVNEVEKLNQANTDSLVSQPNFMIYCRSNATDGSAQSLFSNIHFGYLAFFYNGATGLNETDVDNACALARAKYF